MELDKDTKIKHCVEATKNNEILKIKQHQQPVTMFLMVMVVLFFIFLLYVLHVKWDFVREKVNYFIYS